MYDEIPLLQFGKVNIQRRPGGLCVRGLQAPWPLHFVTPKNFCVRNDHRFGFPAEDPAGKGTQMGGESGVLSLEFGASGSLAQDFGFRIIQAIFLPYFAEALALAVIITKDVAAIVLSHPAMELGEKPPPLRFGYRRIRRMVRQRTK